MRSTSLLNDSAILVDQKWFLDKRTLRVNSCFLLLLRLCPSYFLLIDFYHSSFVLTCSLFAVLHPVFSFPCLSGVFRHPTDSSCFRKNQQRLPWDYAWVGFNDYIKPRTKSRTTCWDLMFCSGGGRGEGRDGSGSGWGNDDGKPMGA